MKHFSSIKLHASFDVVTSVCKNANVMTVLKGTYYPTNILKLVMSSDFLFVLIILGNNSQEFNLGFHLSSIKTDLK